MPCSLIISAILHATEDPEKVINKLIEIIGFKPRVKKERLVGHFGNPIFYITVKLRGRRAQEAFMKFVSSLPERDRKAVLSGAFKDERGKTYLRLDKQQLMLGKFVLSNRDAVKLVFTPPAWGKTE